ncbi:hypothetical protein Bca52824_037424 [Brassica carinata]|uniref:Endonuclease/exonuclease/phosphatase domain-containing protein n=1 Tax=Brassica carinata TaxID=52824 RepID=A0A8X7S6V3_BRACI|nr:hypothetical protein Bca52824_037424 [Brassica carinata]
MVDLQLSKRLKFRGESHLFWQQAISRAPVQVLLNGTRCSAENVRVEQANEAVEILGANNPNVVFGGDINWDDKLDGKFPLPEKWVDVWEALKPGDPGFTYDTKANPMLSGNRALQKRLDRFFCRLDDYKVGGVEMVGKEAIPGLSSYVKEKRVRGDVKKLELPVLPSDHFGLLLTLLPK